MPPKIRVMKYTIALIDEQNHESLDRGLAYEKFLLGPTNSSAPLELQSYGVSITKSSVIARIEPVHIHAARDHLVLTSTEILEIQQDEAETLFDSVKDIFTEMATAIYRPRANRWFIESPHFNHYQRSVLNKRKDEILITGCPSTQILLVSLVNGANGKTIFK